MDQQPSNDSAISMTAVSEPANIAHPVKLDAGDVIADHEVKTGVALALDQPGRGLSISPTSTGDDPRPGNTRKRSMSAVLFPPRSHKMPRKLEQSKSAAQQSTPSSSPSPAPYQADSDDTQTLSEANDSFTLSQPSSPESVHQEEGGGEEEEEEDGVRAESPPPAGDDNPSDDDGILTTEGYDTDDSVGTTTTSVDDSVRDYFFENGRRYHRFREGLYPFPNDDMEQEREEDLHSLIASMCDGKLHWAPIGSHPHRIMDIGTGTGIWAIEMADLFPSANVLGVDLSPIQPQWSPPNASFMVDDVESAWSSPKNHFDYIHSRHNALGIRDWTTLCAQSFKHLKPGGWLELQDFHHEPMDAATETPLHHSGPLAAYWHLIGAGLSTLGIDLHAVAGGRIADCMRRAGFVDVTESVYHVPIGTWPEDEHLRWLGKSFREVFLDGLQALALGPLVRCLHWDRSRMEVLLMNVRRAYQDDSVSLYMPFHVVTGQKPP